MINQRKYEHIEYFNGGIFKKTNAVELSYKEVELLHDASKQNWEKVRDRPYLVLFLKEVWIRKEDTVMVFIILMS